MPASSTSYAPSFMPVLSQHEPLVYQHRPAEVAPGAPLVEDQTRRLVRGPVKAAPWSAQAGTRRDRWV